MNHAWGLFFLISHGFWNDSFFSSMHTRKSFPASLANRTIPIFFLFPFCHRKRYFPLFFFSLSYRPGKKVLYVHSYAISMSLISLLICLVGRVTRPTRGGSTNFKSKFFPLAFCLGLSYTFSVPIQWPNPVSFNSFVCFCSMKILFLKGNFFFFYNVFFFFLFFFDKHSLNIPFRTKSFSKTYKNLQKSASGKMIKAIRKIMRYWYLCWINTIQKVLFPIEIQVISVCAVMSIHLSSALPNVCGMQQRDHFIYKITKI